MDGQNILNSINIIAEKIFKSVEGEVFQKLDKLLIIDSKILKEEPLKTLFTNAQSEGLIVLGTSFIIFFFIYYVLVRMLSMYNGEENENVFKYILKVIICTICSVSSVYICEQILDISGMLTNVISSIGKSLTGEDICFTNLREIVVNLDSFMGNEALSIDGIIKGIISFGATSILIAFSIRYVTVIFLILVSPLAIMFIASPITSGIFKSWMKMFITNLLLQNIVIIILMIPLSLKETNDNMFKIVLVGSIYLLYKINNFTKDFLGNVTEQVIKRK